MSGAAHEGRLALVALQFLTRVPVPAWRDWDDAWLNDCVRHFPLVGLFVGGCGVLVLWAAAQVWPPAVAAVLAVAATAWITGAFHEDGLADTFDALGGQVPREKALAILKDPRIGSYGAMALILVTLARVTTLAALASVDLTRAVAALVLAHALGRLAPVLVMARLPYGGDLEHARAKPLATAVRPVNLVVALGWSLLVAAIASGWLASWRPGWALAATLLVATLMGRWLLRRLGGYTGDTLGASEQMAELAVLLVFAADWPV
jgi:adenosylcobinamide-GDP ribazoletransferase